MVTFVKNRTYKEYMIATNAPEKRAVGVFTKRKEAEQAINELKASGFPMEKFSLIAKDADKVEQVGEAEVSDRIGDQDVNSSTGAVADTLTASTWGSFFVGLSSLALPGLGAVIAAGSVGVALTTSVAGLAVGAAATNNLIKALADLGIPEERARVYIDRLIQSDYLVIVEGTDNDIQSAQAILDKHRIQYWDVYQPSQGENNS